MEGLRYSMFALGVLLSMPAVTHAAVIADTSSALPSGYEPSGAVWHTALEELFIVGDDGELTALTANGEHVNTWDIGGDLEAVTVADVNSSLVYIGIENPDAILEFDVVAGEVTGRTWGLTAWMTGSDNQGLEALTFVPNGDHPYADSINGGLFYAGLQADATIHVFDVPLITGDEVVEIDVLGAPSGIGSDLSGLHYEATTGVLYAVYDSYNTIAELTTSGEVLSTSTLAGHDQEGLALRIDCDTNTAQLFISSDDNPPEVLRYDDQPVTCLAVEEEDLEEEAPADDPVEEDPAEDPAGEDPVIDQPVHTPPTIVDWYGNGDRTVTVEWSDGSVITINAFKWRRHVRAMTVAGSS